MVKPILYYYNNFKRREKLLDAYEKTDTSFLQRAISIGMDPFDIVHRRINHIYQLQRQHSKNQKQDEESNASTAKIGVYFIVIGLVCIGISNII